MNGFRLPFIEMLHHFGWLRWVVKAIAVIKVVNEVKMKRCNGLHTTDMQVID